MIIKLIKGILTNITYIGGQILQASITKIEGDEKASRNNLKCYNKQKELGANKKKSFLEKSLSLKLSYPLIGILKNIKSQLIIGTMGDITR